jgi:LysR family transcriptional regulator, glycine cleavage system transcriptional activator
MTHPTRTLLPSTTALRVFEVAARHLTCTGAAEELFLTQSAVSKQIRTLEEALGVTLFVRVNRGLVLTEQGRAYLEDVRPLLTLLAAASARVAMRATDPTTLTLRILAIVGDRWLLPRFSNFAHAHPLIEVQFTSLLSKDGKEQSLTDGEFRFGDGQWPGFVADYLFGRELLLVGSPQLLQSQSPLRTPSDVLSCPWLQHFQVPHAWSEYLAAHQLETHNAPKVTRYEFYSTLLKAAAAGMGLALVPRVFVHDELARGELINPMACGVTSRFGYYFVSAEHRQTDPALATLRAWLLDQADATAQEQGGVRAHRCGNHGVAAAIEPTAPRGPAP